MWGNDDRFGEIFPEVQCNIEEIMVTAYYPDTVDVAALSGFAGSSWQNDRLYGLGEVKDGNVCLG